MNKKHALIMIACCIVPIVGFGLATAFNIPFKTLFTFGMILLCPLSHLLMMKFMVHGERHVHSADETQSPTIINNEAQT